MPPLPLRNLDQPLKRLLPILPIPLRLLPLPLPRLATQHDHTRRPLRLPRQPQLRPTGHVDVRYRMVLAQHGDVGDDVHGGDVGGEDDDGEGQGGGGRGGGGGFTQGFDGFFDAALDGAVGGGCII